jgi:hypothetical protein
MENCSKYRWSVALAIAAMGILPGYASTLSASTNPVFLSQQQQPPRFIQPPRFVEAVATHNNSNATTSTYYFTIRVPEGAGASLRQIQLEQLEGVEFVRLRQGKHVAFLGTRSERGEEIPIASVKRDRDRRIFTVVFDRPVLTGSHVTIGLRPVRNPDTGGVYLYRVGVSPSEESPWQVIGVARLHFYDRGNNDGVELDL